MIRITFKALSTIFCLGMTWWLVRYEAFPGLFADNFAGYRGLMSSGTLLIDNWTKILYQGKPIGYSHTLLAAPEDSLGEASRLENRTILQMKVLGTMQHITATTAVALDSVNRLMRFNFVLNSRQYSARIEGERTHGETFAIRILTAAGASESEIEIPDDVIVYSPLTELALRKLRPGQRLRIKTLDPVSMRAMSVVCEAIGREMIEMNGKQLSAMRLSVAYQGMTVQSWMSDEGIVVRQETPLGWVMEACTQQEALSLNFDASTMDDMILASAVPISGGLIHPEKCKVLTLRLDELYLDPEQLNSPRQRVERAEGSTATIVLQAGVWPASGTPLGMYPEGMEAYLASTAYVQADHPEIRKYAIRIVGDTTDSLEASRRIYEWVSTEIEKNATVSLPSALDVLRQRVGDCNEHTYLFVALARAVDIPAQIRIGLVFHQGAFYYHAWPSVYVGEWVEMDPTLYQPAVDATHLALLEGELDKQLELMKVIGRLKAHVLDED